MNNSDMEKGYWDKRAASEYIYKKEKFYTITAIPYYYKRRKLILKTINKLIQDRYSVCDFGCGDGEYIRILSDKNKDSKFHGVDISSEMIGVAKSTIKSKRVSWEVSGNGINGNEKYDVIYSSAVFAHINDNNVFPLVSNLANHLSEGGLFVLCEQTAPFIYRGSSFVRRPLNEYIRLLEEVGFSNFDCFIIDFWLHRLLFERKIGKFFVNNYMNKHNETNKTNAMIRLNQNVLYKFLSNLCATLSFPRVFHGVKDRWGYCFIVASK